MPYFYGLFLECVLWLLINFMHLYWKQIFIFILKISLFYRMRPLEAKKSVILFILILAQGFDYSRTCNCDQQYFCNCSSNHLQQVPKVPANALGLDLSFNQIESIDMNDLSPYSELKTLNLHKNKLKFIHKEAFKSQHKLESLICP